MYSWGGLLQECSTEAICKWLVTNIRKLYEGSVLYENLRHERGKEGHHALHPHALEGSPNKKDKNKGGKKLEDAKDAVDLLMNTKKELKKIKMHQIPENMFK